MKPANLPSFLRRVPAWTFKFALLIFILMMSSCGGPLTIDPPDPTATHALPTPQGSLENSSSEAILPTQLPDPIINPVETSAQPYIIPSPLPTDTLSPTMPALSTVRFAVIGDYGGGGKPAADVANLVKSWNPNFIVTVGDNNYPDGAAETIDQNIGQFYHEYIYPYQGQYGPGADINRFFPTLGNHDWTTSEAKPYLDYFTLPGNERYYDFTWGPVHIFALDGDWREPDGFRKKSPQAEWLQERMAASTLPWQFVVVHQAPYSSGMQGSTTWMRWPFEAWGADAVLSGHDHIYERLKVGGIPYFVNGVGGGAIYYFVDILPESQARYNDYGAMLITATEQQILFEFYNREGDLIDQHQISSNQ